MELEYGPFTLKVIDVNRFERRAVYTPDGADLLYIRNVIGVSATYAPGGLPRMPSTMSVSDSQRKVAEGTDNTLSILASNPRGIPDGTGGSLATIPTLESDLSGSAPVDRDKWHTGPQTDMELRDVLMTPRQKLIIWAYDRQTGQPIRWMESPRPGFACDATTGPTPISCDVIAQPGEPLSVGVYFQIQTDVLPCPVGSDRLVLSHRWQMLHTHDQDFYLTRVIRGEIVFNGGYVNTFGVTPDSLRNQFLHPTPVGFRRGIPEVTASPDGLTIRYTITDTDPTITFAPGDSGATSIQILEKLTLTKPWASWRV